MARYVAFLRGVNVGGVNLKMAEVATALADAGFTNVKTILALSLLQYAMTRARHKLLSSTQICLTSTQTIRQNTSLKARSLTLLVGEFRRISSLKNWKMPLEKATASNSRQ